MLIWEFPKKGVTDAQVIPDHTLKTADLLALKQDVFPHESTGCLDNSASLSWVWLVSLWLTQALLSAVGLSWSWLPSGGFGREEGIPVYYLASQSGSVPVAVTVSGGKAEGWEMSCALGLKLYTIDFTAFFWGKYINKSVYIHVWEIDSISW